MSNTQVTAAMSAALAIAYGDTARTFHANDLEVRRVLQHLTGERVPMFGPMLGAAIRRCAGHVRAQLPDTLRAFDPPPAERDDTADLLYLCAVKGKYGRRVKLTPLPQEVLR